VSWALAGAASVARTVTAIKYFWIGFPSCGNFSAWGSTLKIAAPAIQRPDASWVGVVSIPLATIREVDPQSILVYDPDRLKDI
jgi:hypothetical protein